MERSKKFDFTEHPVLLITLATVLSTVIAFFFLKPVPFSESEINDYTWFATRLVKNGLYSSNPQVNLEKETYEFETISSINTLNYSQISITPLEFESHRLTIWIPYRGNFSFNFSKDSISAPLISLDQAWGISIFTTLLYCCLFILIYTFLFYCACFINKKLKEKN